MKGSLMTIDHKLVVSALWLVLKIVVLVVCASSEVTSFVYQNF